MFQKMLSKFVLPVVMFIIAGGITLISIQVWRGYTKASDQPIPQTKSTASQPEVIEGVRGLNPNEVVALPELPSLNGGTVALSSLKEDYLLLCFVSTSCGGCAKDSDFWKALKEEAAKRKVAFYLISVADEQSETERFVRAHGLEGLPMLYDPDRRAARSFKAGFSPQYVLLTAKGQVIARWDGLRYYQGQPEKLSQLFERITH